jgi:hypothetical protein
MNAEYSPGVVPLAVTQVQATVGETDPVPADWMPLRSTTAPAAPPTHGNASTKDHLREMRRAQIDRLREIQGEFLTSPADPALVSTYAPKFLQYAADVYAARSESELVLMGIKIDQLQSAWEQFRRQMARRDRARHLAVGLLMLVFGFLVAITVFDEYFALDVTDEIRLLHVPVYVVVWSLIGSICSLLYRFNRSADVELEDPMRMLLFRPLMGVTLGSFSYLLVQLGFLTISTPGSAPGDTASTVAQLAQNDRVTHLMIVVAFIVGFSDRLSEGILKSLVGRFGGDRNGELVSSERIASSGSPSALTAIFNAGGTGPAGYARASTDSQTASVTVSSTGMDGTSELPPSGAPGPAPAAVQAPGTATPDGPLSLPVRPVTPPASGSTTTGP